MALTVARDLDVVSDGIARWLCEARGASSVDIFHCVRPSEGLSSETVVVHASVMIAGHTRDQRVVVRLPPIGDGTFPDYRLDVQAAVQMHARANGVPTPAVEYVANPEYLGAPFLAMPFIDGHIPTSPAQTDSWVNDAPVGEQRALGANYLDALGAVHQLPLDGINDVVPERAIDAELAYWREYLDWYADGERPVPVLDDALEWCAQHRPPDPPNALLWGDARIGNVVFDDDRRVVAVLDWEMTTVGAPEHDIGWSFVLESVQDELLHCRVAGFPTRDEARTQCEASLGRALEHLEWFETFALVRSAAIMTRVTILHERAGVPTHLPIVQNPLLDILARRIAAASPPPSRPGSTE